jgi:hypothetical protein
MYKSRMNIQRNEPHGIGICDNAWRWGVKIPNVVGVDEQIIIELYFKNLWKQRVTWKLHYYNSPTWVFFKVNNNQPMDFSQN